MGRRQDQGDQSRRRRLSSGALAEIVRDEFTPDGVQLIVDGTAQSHVFADHPRDLFFEYVQRMAHLIEVLTAPERPLTAVHLGAGAMTLPRYLHATRPGSRQQVIELEPELVALVREQIPLPRDSGIRIRYGDARTVAAALPSGLRGRTDLIVVDIFAGARTPAHVTSVEFYTMLRTLLSPAGAVLVNVADGGRLDFARSQAATIGHVFAHVVAVGESGVMKGRRFGNVVFGATDAPPDQDAIRRLGSAGPFPGTVLAGAEFGRFAASGRLVTDATAIASPAPPRGLFGERT